MNYLHLPIVREQLGRPSKQLQTLDIPAKSLYFFRVKLDQGGFDNGGAKWSLHKPLYCVSDGVTPLAFAYADNKQEAALNLQIDPSWLRYLDIHIPIVKKGGMYHLIDKTKKTIGFTTTYALARYKWLLHEKEQYS